MFCPSTVPACIITLTCKEDKLHHYDDSKLALYHNEENFHQQKLKYDISDNYRNVPKFTDRYVWTNSADPDWTAPRGAV